ncbi:MAG: hypothetical protein HY805_11050 [Nitrospirae bacterium]|nr:hypothetical protein [Nitrospirota bacterium]
MKKVLFLVVILIMSFSGVSESTDVYLKNGSIIKNVTAYEKVDGKVRLSISGGIVEISEEDVLGIEEKALEPPREDKIFIKPAPEITPTVKEDNTEEKRQALKDKLTAIEERLNEIKNKETEYEKLLKEYDSVRLRIEVLFQSGLKRAIADGKDASKWLNYLIPQERQWVQLNTLKKDKLEKDMMNSKREVDYLFEEKKTLLDEKKVIEDKLKELEED